MFPEYRCVHCKSLIPFSLSPGPVGSGFAGLPESSSSCAPPLLLSLQLLPFSVQHQERRGCYFFCVRPRQVVKVSGIVGIFLLVNSEDLKQCGLKRCMTF